MLAQQIKDSMAELSPAERKIARAMLADYPRAGLGTVQTLADQAGVSLPSVAKALASSLSAKPVVVTANAGPGGRLFGAVTTADIAGAVAAAGGPSVDKRKIEIGQSIKTTGDYTVSIRLHPEVSAKIGVQVVAG